MNRPRYQHGFFSRHKRRKGPEVWVYRWREIDANGKLKMRAFVVGPVTQYSTETAAWKAVSTLRLDINHHTFRPEGQPETFEQLVEHYRMIELDLEKESERKVHQTKQTYGVYLKTRIVPRWGGQPFREIFASKPTAPCSARGIPGRQCLASGTRPLAFVDTRLRGSRLARTNSSQGLSAP